MMDSRSVPYRVLYQNKFEKQCISLAFIIRILCVLLLFVYFSTYTATIIDLMSVVPTHE